MFDYVEARSSNVYSEVVFFGLQYILNEYFIEPITIGDVQEAKEYADAHGIPFNYDGWSYIANELDGNIPVVIKAIPEGSVVPTNVPLFTIESTDEKVFWVVSWMETILMKVWYTTNIATRSYYVKQMLMKYAEKTMDNPNVDFAFVNFGDRGSSSVESAGIGGVAHLTQFLGTDNFNSIKIAKEQSN
jgi:nicotinamide phosphoribosyltransferase